MDRTTGRLFTIALVVVLALTGGAALILGGGGGGVDPSLARREAVGVVVGVAADGLTDVTGFTLRQEGGALLDFGIALENAAEFPLAHLAEHQATAAPVIVTYVDDGNALVAVRVEDAPGGE